jgi:hypothetical protein
VHGEDLVGGSDKTDRETVSRLCIMGVPSTCKRGHGTAARDRFGEIIKGRVLVVALVCEPGWGCLGNTWSLRAPAARWRCLDSGRLDRVILRSRSSTGGNRWQVSL